MKTLFLTFIGLITLITYIAYSMFTTYGTMMSVIINPIACPETHCVCVEKECEKCEPCGFGYCNYDVVCNQLYCDACPANYKKELETCHRLLENLEDYE